MAMTGTILAIDLAKAKSLFCWYRTEDQTHELRTIPSTPQAFHDALVEQKVDRVVIEVCDMAGWVQDLCCGLGIPIQVANVNTEGWRWRNVKNKTDKTDALKLARLSANDELPTVYLPQRRVRHWRSLILYRQKPHRAAHGGEERDPRPAGGRGAGDEGRTGGMDQRVAGDAQGAGQADRPLRHR